MKKNVVVIGGGLGGLSAAVACAQNGHSVTLLEKQPSLGGYGISFSRKGYVFDPSLHATPCGANGDHFHFLIQQLGISNDVSFIKIQKGFKTFLGDFSFDLSTDYSVLLHDLIRAFPASEKGLLQLDRDVKRFAPLYHSVIEGLASPLSIAMNFVPKIPSFLFHANTSTHDYLSGYISDKTLRAILFHPSIFFGIPMKQFPSVNFLLMFYLIFIKGLYTIRGGGNALSLALESRLKKLGVTVCTNTEVTSITLSKGRAVGVLTNNNGFIQGDDFIANVNTPTLVKGLIGIKHFPASYVKTFNSLRPSLSLLQLHCGLNCATSQCGITNHITTVFPDADVDKYLESRSNDLFPAGYSIIAPHIADVASSMPKKSVLSILGGVSSSVWLSLPKKKYLDEKKRCQDRFLEIVGMHFPDITSQCEVIDCATPKTFLRYTGNPDGAILGFDCSLGMQRKIMAISHMPIRNIFLASAWTDKLGGYMQVVSAGISAAKKCGKA